MDSGMRFMMAPKSHKAFPIVSIPIMHGIVNLPGFVNFCGNFLWMITLHYSIKAMFLSFSNSHLPDKISFINLAYVDICS